MKILGLLNNTKGFYYPFARKEHNLLVGLYRALRNDRITRYELRQC